jgi:hypothetical protein
VCGRKAVRREKDMVTVEVGTMGETAQLPAEEIKALWDLQQEVAKVVSGELQSRAPVQRQRRKTKGIFPGTCLQY